jgi:hypothetical protein
MGSENSADQACDLLASWLSDGAEVGLEDMGMKRFGLAPQKASKSGET